MSKPETKKQMLVRLDRQKVDALMALQAQLERVRSQVEPKSCQK